MNAEMLTILENDPPQFLDEIRYGGLKMFMSYNPEKDNVILELQTETQHRIAEIPKDKVNEARNHPCLFVEDPASLFKDTPMEIPVEFQAENVKERISDYGTTKSLPYDQEKDFNPKRQFPFGRGGTHCECCGKKWRVQEPGYMVTSEDFIGYIAELISDDDLDEVLDSLGDQEELIACSYCIKLITGKDIEF